MNFYQIKHSAFKAQNKAFLTFQNTKSPKLHTRNWTFPASKEENKKHKFSKNENIFFTKVAKLNRRLQTKVDISFHKGIYKINLIN